MKYRALHLQIRGTVPLIMHNGSLADPLDTITKQMKKLSSKRDKTDADHEELARLEWYGSLYLHNSEPCIPGEVLESMLVESAKKKKRGVQAKAGLLCDSNYPLLYDGPRDPDELWKDGHFRLTAGARVQRNRVMRTRPIFHQWQADIEIKYLDGLLNERDVIDFLEYGGAFVGLCDWRPKFGRFEVVLDQKKR